MYTNIPYFVLVYDITSQQLTQALHLLAVHHIYFTSTQTSELPT